MTNTELQTLLNDAASKLGEHFTTVLILASWNDTDSESHYTDGFNAGCGDFYARQGLAGTYIESRKAILIAKAVRGEIEE